MVAALQQDDKATEKQDAAPANRVTPYRAVAAGSVRTVVRTPPVLRHRSEGRRSQVPRGGSRCWE